MKHICGISAVLVAAFLLSACGPKIYTNPSFEQYRSAHKTVAVLPFEVILDPNKLPKDYTLEMKHDAENAEAYNFQQELYFQFLRKQEKGEYTVEFQDVDRTKALLSKATITNRDLSKYTKEEIKAILGVDALISGTIHRSKPMSTGTAVVLGLLVGFWGNTNEVNVSLNIHDATSGDLLWKYDHKASGSVGSSSEKLAESLMKNVSKKFPYKKAKV